MPQYISNLEEPSAISIFFSNIRKSLFVGTNNNECYEITMNSCAPGTPISINSKKAVKVNGNVSKLTNWKEYKSPGLITVGMDSLFFLKKLEYENEILDESFERIKIGARSSSNQV